MNEASWNGTAGEVVDSSGSSHNGTAVNGLTPTTGKFGNAGSFGSGKYVDAGTINATGTELTMSVWVKPNSFQNNFPYISTLMGEEGGGSSVMSLRLGDAGLANNKPQFSVGNLVTLSANSGINTGSWYHIVGVYDGSTTKLYINGVLDATTSTSGTYNVNTNFAIGKTLDGRYLDGLMDDVRVYNRALSATEVTELYNLTP
jgi:hypothetical protein